MPFLRFTSPVKQDTTLFFGLSGRSRDSHDEPHMHRRRQRKKIYDARGRGSARAPTAEPYQSRPPSLLFSSQKQTMQQTYTEANRNKHINTFPLLCRRPTSLKSTPFLPPPPTALQRWLQQDQYTARLLSTSLAHRIIPPSRLYRRDAGIPHSLKDAHAFALRPPT